MTASTHVYTAVVGEHALSVKGGSVALDAGVSPHVQGTLTVALPSAEVLAALDPRESPRVTLTAAASFSLTAQERIFDLGIRDRTVDYESGEVTLTVASDEALLEDWAPLEDLDLIDHAGDLLTLCETVVSEALGESVTITGTTADATPAWEARNLIPNPAVSGVTGYVGYGCTITTSSWMPHGAVSLQMHTPTTADSYTAVGGDTGEMRLGMRAGQTYVVAATGSVRSAIGGAGGNARRIVVYFWNGYSYKTIQSAAASATVNAETRVSLEFTVPDDAQYAFIRLYHGGTSGVMAWSVPTLVQRGPGTVEEDAVPWHGGSTDTDLYEYTWDGTAHSSVSIRTPMVDRDRESVIIRAGSSGLSVLVPLVQAAGLRLVCDEARAWTLRDEEHRAPGSLAIRYGINMLGGRDAISRSEGIWCDAQVTRYRWTDRSGVQQERVDVYALTDPYTRLVLVEIDGAYPGPGRSEYGVRRAQQRGREVTATVVADWRAAAEQPITIALPDTDLQTGITQSVRYDLDRDEMTVTTRTTDTPPLAWVLGPDDLTWDDANPVAWDDLTDWSDL